MICNLGFTLTFCHMRLTNVGIRRYLLVTGMIGIFTARSYSNLQVSFVLVLQAKSKAIAFYCKPAFAFFLYCTRWRSTEDNGTVSVFCSAIQLSTYSGGLKGTWVFFDNYSLKVMGLRATSVMCVCVWARLNSMALVRERTIPTERPPPVVEVSANFWG
jgi:hypothetical protein